MVDQTFHPSIWQHKNPNYTLIAALLAQRLNALLPRHSWWLAPKWWPPPSSRLPAKSNLQGRFERWQKPSRTWWAYVTKPRPTTTWTSNWKRLPPKCPDRCPIFWATSSWRPGSAPRQPSRRTVSKRSTRRPTKYPPQPATQTKWYFALTQTESALVLPRAISRCGRPGDWATRPLNWSRASREKPNVYRPTRTFNAACWRQPKPWQTPLRAW